MGRALFVWVRCASCNTHTHDEPLPNTYTYTYTSTHTKISIFDSFHFMEKHADPTFGLHAMMAEYWGKMALRIADAKVRMHISVD